VDINELKDRETALNAQIEKSEALEKQLRDLADTDVLTGLPNGRAFFDRLETEFSRVGRYGQSLSVRCREPGGNMARRGPIDMKKQGTNHVFAVKTVACPLFFHY
jgi:hypothetical protein